MSAGDVAEREVPTVPVLVSGTNLEAEMPHCTFSVLGRALVGATLACLCASPVHAQSLRLRVTEESSGRPVAGAVARSRPW